VQAEKIQTGKSFGIGGINLLALCKEMGLDWNQYTKLVKRARLRSHQQANAIRYKSKDWIGHAKTKTI